jgi:hypothetical protein
MDLLELVNRYGLAAAGVVWTLYHSFKFVTERYYPARQKSQDEKDKAERATREAVDRSDRETRAMLLKSQIDREDRDFERRAKMEERTIVAIEKMSLAMEGMSLGITAGNERIAALIASHSQHANFQFGAHIELKEKLDDLHGLLEYRSRLEELEKKLSDTQERIKLQEGG